MLSATDQIIGRKYRPAVHRSDEPLRRADDLQMNGDSGGTLPLSAPPHAPAAAKAAPSGLRTNPDPDTSRMGNILSQGHQVAWFSTSAPSVHRIDVALRNHLVSYNEQGTTAG